MSRNDPRRAGSRLPVLILWAVMLTVNGWMSLPLHADEIKIGGTGSALATMRILGDAYRATEPGTTISVLPSMGSGGGIGVMLSGAIQIAVTSRPVKESERKHGAVALEYGRTPFAFATRTTTKADRVGIRDVAQIYSGKLSAWPDGGRIRFVLRPIGDSDSDLIKSISEDVRRAYLQAQSQPGMLFAVTDQDSAASIEAVRGSFGTTTLAQVLSEKRRIKLLELDGIAPTVTAVATGAYSYYKRMFIVIHADSPPAVQRFMSFVRSPAATAILTRIGYWVPPR